MRDDLRPGERFPDIELPDHAGNPRRLSELASGDPVYLNFFRGFWCPKEQAFLRLLTGWQREVEVAYAKIVSVSVDPPEVNGALRAGLDARWTFLSDIGRRYLDELDLRETTDTLNNPYWPASFTCTPTSPSGRSSPATGSGGAPPWRSCAETSGRSPARSGPTGRYRRHELAVVRPGGRGATGWGTRLGRGARF
jgi:peroxiredoxin